MDTRGVEVDVDRAEDAMVRAASHGHVKVVKWLIQRDLGGGSTWAMYEAATNGHLEVAQYLHAQGFTGCNQETFTRAAEDGRLAVVQWLWTEFHGDLEADLLSMRDDNEILEWGPPLGVEMSAAARNGHLEVMQYLYSIALTLVGGGGEERGSEVGDLSIRANLKWITWLVTLREMVIWT
ncbi:putative ankyrin repeat protein L63 [Phytophthora citrophthora]|uniref:Ankyrin repeat protein L63 n=1 Tax=Phytophthora citrophthora TaxID=4793 RepID=A0AAD9GX04_9STRA|nr:putative ankyrin repeat protein L63 [Phytophthora citrophthora]